MDALAAPDSGDSFDGATLADAPELLAALSPASEVVIRMHYMDGLTHVEIGEALEIPVGTVKSRLAYGLAAMRRQSVSSGSC